MKRTLFVVALALFVAVQGALAGTHAKSVNVALIPNTTGAADGYGNWGGGAAGTLVMGYFPGYNITIVHPTLVTSAASLALAALVTRVG